MIRKEPRHTYEILGYGISLTHLEVPTALLNTEIINTGALHGFLDSLAESEDIEIVTGNTTTA